MPISAAGRWQTDGCDWGTFSLSLALSESAPVRDSSMCLLAAISRLVGIGHAYFRPFVRDLGFEN